MSTSEAPATNSLRHIGQVKWFNNKAGFGFVTMQKDGEECDIFAHYTTVKVQDSQYKYLVQGEYVEFELAESSSSEHQFQTANVTGINSGKLMCETRQAQRATNDQKRPPNRPRGNRGNKSSDENDDSEGFTKVQRSKQQKKTT